MAAGKTVKLKLRHGDREIEIEGARAEVDELLKTWWAATTTAAPSSSEALPSVPAARRAASSRKAKRPDHPIEQERSRTFICLTS
jgi:uncharacterized protein (DUF58 family)